MSRDVRQNLEQSSIDSILKSLANRPNVSLTLILSRKDGSIIRATGFAGAQGSSEAASRIYDRAQPNEETPSTTQEQSETRKNRDDAAVQREHVSPVQRLAGSIYEFVNVSSKLAASISQSTSYPTTARGEISANLSTASKEYKSDSAASTNDEEVQLLRMRTKDQEIIIFPDPNYLCCVVQSLSKTAVRSET